ncbi:ABC transporter ATP-binding protein [Streptomyces sp. ST2-7A]|uniref:ABC transporter ATP-binding protein n=1 Tax=Streptomyces sp. ST2-7A TaxID=2907214 RepID=UPI001F274873|nr:ATP-binding cassette domain-containing protein [Streptomyces sp. ST2-7A]
MRGLCCDREGTEALRDITLDIDEGEILAVIGPRGSGRSSLLGCLAGRLPIREGEVWFGDLPVHALPEAARTRMRREHVGWIGDTPRLLPELTARENAALPLLLTGTGSRAAHRAAREWLERLDAAGFSRRRPAALTRAQRQRVAIARALVTGPTVLLADEPGAPLRGLDRLCALRALVAAARSHHITTVITGTGTELVGLVDRVITLEDGRLVDPAPTPGAPTAPETCSLSG